MSPILSIRHHSEAWDTYWRRTTEANRQAYRLAELGLLKKAPRIQNRDSLQLAVRTLQTTWMHDHPLVPSKEDFLIRYALL